LGVYGAVLATFVYIGYPRGGMWYPQDLNAGTVKKRLIGLIIFLLFHS
tara:strand:- start:246 stop:389 length:144 start_codon:yes stop_codon:yes gene_type:complete